MNIDEVVAALNTDKVMHCVNSFETLKTKEDDLGTRVVATRKTAGGDDEQQIMYLTRFEQLYKHCTFGLGPYKDVTSKAAAAEKSK